MFPVHFFVYNWDIEYDKFIHITDSKHEADVNDFHSRVLSSGDIYIELIKKVTVRDVRSTR
jgi:methionyl-tRNA synthetase